MVGKLSALGSRFWSELKRRRVIRSAVAYVVVAWIIVEGSSLIFPALLLPQWTVRLIVIVAILGLPLVIVLAWMFDIELKPEQADQQAEAAPALPDSASTGLPIRIPPMPAAAVASVAVLPFENLSPDKQHGYIAEGIATEIQHTLAKVHRLRVASRTSSFSLAGQNVDVREIARRLGVHFVISGTVKCIDDRIRIIVGLDNADEGVQVWSELYDRELKDIFATQHEIAHAITSNFGTARLRDEITSAAARPTDNLDAWGLVQRARSYALHFTPQALKNAVPLLRQAIELDADYAAAHAALASVLSEQVLNGLSDDPGSDRASALESAERACSIAPADPFTLKMCGASWAYFGDSARSLGALRRAVEIATFDFGAWGFMGWPLAGMGSERDLQELHEIMERILNSTPLHPGNPYWLYHRSVAYTCQGHDDLAVEFARQSVDNNPGFPWAWMQYANALGVSQSIQEARKAISQCEKISPGLTPGYYAQMIREMSDNEETVRSRLAGFQVLDQPGA